MEPQQPQTSPAKESRSWGPRPDPPCLSSQSGHAYPANLRISLFSLPSILGEHLLVPPSLGEGGRKAGAVGPQGVTRAELLLQKRHPRYGELLNTCGSIVKCWFKCTKGTRSSGTPKANKKATILLLAVLSCKI